MRVTPVFCFCLLLFLVLMYSAYGTILSAEATSQNQPQVMHGGRNKYNKWSKVENQRRHTELHVVQHAGSGGRTVNGAHPHGGGRRNSANSLSIKSSSLFMAVFKHLIFGLLLLVCFY